MSTDGDDYTKWEHYVPRVYYKGFSKVIAKGDKEKLLSWVIDAKLLTQKEKPLDIEDFCAKNDLYELKSMTGEYIARNLIENAFCRIESSVGKVLKSISDKSQNAMCLKCNHILSEEDKSILIILITMLLFRNPQTIEKGVDYLQSINPKMEENAAQNATLLNLLPLGVDKEWDDKTIIRNAVERYSGMEFQIGIAPDDVIITSDRPVIEWPPCKNDPFNRPQAVVLSLTSRLVLYLFPIEKEEQIGRSFFFYMSDLQINDIQKNVAARAERWIFSRNKLNEYQWRSLKKQLIM